MSEPSEPVASKQTPKHKHQLWSSYTILLVITVVVACITWIAACFTPDITPTKISQLVMSPILGVLDGIEISLFLLVFGGCMGIVNKVGAIDTGIRVLIKKLKGRELVLVPIIMAIFALLGSTYGFCEETIPFYALLGATLYLAGYDTLVSSATVLFGAGVGCLGSTVNPFANGVAIATLHDAGIECNTGVIIVLGVILAVMAYIVSLYFILSYAHKIKKDKGSSLLSLQEQEACEAEYGNTACVTIDDDVQLSFVQKLTLILFGLTFVVMIMGFIPWENFGFEGFVAGQQTQEITQAIDANQISKDWTKHDVGGDLVFDSPVKAHTQEIETTHLAWSALLIGKPIGEWYFNEASAWFFVMALIIAAVARLSEEEAVDAFIGGASEMVGVALVVGLARAINLILVWSGLDIKILSEASLALQGLSAGIFAPLCYLIYLGLSIVITSTSALASVSLPIMGPLAHSLGFSPDVMVMIFVAANGLANLFSPTAVFLPGLVLAHIQYSTYLKWALKPILVIAILSIFILTIAMMLL